MSVDLYTGTPGTGKSLDVARKIRKALRSGTDVIANFSINPGAVRYRKRGCRGEFFEVDNQVSPGMLYRYAKKTMPRHLTAEGRIKEGSILLVLDECQILFNSRDWRSADRRDWLIFFAQHRKFGFDCILVCQMERSIDRQIRGQVEKEFNHRRLGSFRRMGKLFTLLAGGPVIITVVYYKQGGRNIKDHAYVFVGGKADFALYDSYKIFK